MTVAFIFPGQGSQAIGMGKALFDAFAASRKIFEEVDEALGEKLSTLMFEGDPAQLQLTANAQPALMAVSLAALRAARKRSRRGAGARRKIRRRPFARRIFGASRRRRPENRRCCAAIAFAWTGHAGAPCRSATAPWRRSSAPIPNSRRKSPAKPPPLRACCAKSPMTMAAARSSSPAPSQAVELAIEIAKENGVKRAMLLPVSAPFHCALMQPAADAMREALGRDRNPAAGSRSGGQRHRRAHARSR